MTKKFNIQDRNGDVVMGPLDEDNVYIRTYGTMSEFDPSIESLKVGEVTHKTFALSGQKPTSYAIVRVE